MSNRSDGPLRITLLSALQPPSSRARIRTWLAPPVDRANVDDIVLASGEALANAFEHGAPPVHIRMRWTEPRTLAVDVNDAGRWAIPVGRPHRGRGMLIMSALMEEQQTNLIPVAAPAATRALVPRGEARDGWVSLFMTEPETNPARTAEEEADEKAVQSLPLDTEDGGTVVIEQQNMGGAQQVGGGEYKNVGGDRSVEQAAADQAQLEREASIHGDPSGGPEPGAASA